MNPLLSEICLYLIHRSRAAGAEPGRTRITKLLYLADVAQCRRDGQPLTGLRWFLWHYGPYAPEAMDLLRRMTAVDLDEEEYHLPSGVRGATYSVSRDTLREPGASLPPNVRRVIDRVVERWALEPMPRLLDYVYFETEPMAAATDRGQELDLSTVSRRSLSPPGPPPPALAPEVLQRLGTRLAEIKRQESTPRRFTPPVYDNEYQEALRQMNSEDTSTDVPGTAWSVGVDANAADSLRAQKE